MAKTSLKELMEKGGGLSGFAWPDNCQNLNIKIDINGKWYVDNSPIGRIELCKLFATVLQCDDDGNFWLVTPVEKVPVYVEDAPQLVVNYDISYKNDQQIITFKTLLGHDIICGHDHPFIMKTASDNTVSKPYIYWRDNMWALINRAVYYDIVNLGDMHEKNDGTLHLFITSQGQQFTIGDISDDV